MTKNVQAKTWSLTVQNGRRWSAGPPSGLSFSQPPSQSYAISQAVSLNLPPYVAGGGATKYWSKISGELPRDLVLGASTGKITGAPHVRGSFSPVIRVSDTIADALEADWVARSTCAGVQWAHDFRNQSEVDKFILGDGNGEFQYDSNDTLCVRRITSDGITGGACLEYFVPAGGHVGMRWSRCFNPVPGDIGYTSGADVNWRSGTDWVDYVKGLYGHPDYHTTQLGGGIQWCGHDFWIQFRYKGINVYDPAHAFADPGGKLFFIDIAGGGNQELVLQAPAASAGRVLRLYTNFGSRHNSGLDAFQGQNGRGPAVNEQPGGAYMCTYSSFTDAFKFPDNEWITILIHVIPGHHNGDQFEPDMSSTSNRKDTGIELWGARYGDTSYTKVYEKLDYVWNFNTPGPDPYGFNVFTPSTFMNGKLANPAASWGRRFDQVIFSTKPIACPQVYA